MSPTGLSSNYAFQKVGDRYYDPALMCFLTRDTELGQLPYTYCGGDPVNCTDPSGHKTKKQPPHDPGIPGGGAPGGGGSSGGGVGGGAGSGGGNAGPVTIPTGNGGSVGTGNGGTATSPPANTPGGGTATGTITGIGSVIGGYLPTTLGGTIKQPFAGGTATVTGTYNPGNGGISETYGYSHPVGPGGSVFGQVGSGGGFTIGGTLNF